MNKRNPSWFTKENAVKKGSKGGSKSWLKRSKGKSKKEIREMMAKAGRNRWKNRKKTSNNA